MNVMPSGLKPNHLRCFIAVIFEGNENCTRKIQAIIEDDKKMLCKMFQGDSDYSEAKQWIKDNL